MADENVLSTREDKKHGAWDYMVAGAKDFGEDVRSTMSYVTNDGPRPKGPSMQNRQKLIDEDYNVRSSN